MQDRVSLYPGRVKLEPVAGQTNLYDLTRADQPTQEGTPLNKASLLKDATAALLGLGTDAVPDDAFVALVLGQGVYGYRVRVQLADGTPVEGATVSGIQPLTGSTLVTGADGTVLGKSASASVTIGCTSPYIDQKAPAAQTVTKTGTITDVTLTLSNNTDMLTISSSQKSKISPMAKTLDVTAVGGGGGGGGGYSRVQDAYTHYYETGGGGGGGYVSTELGIQFPSAVIRTIAIVIGARGLGGSCGSRSYGSSTDQYSPSSGSDGGATSVSVDDTTVSAEGGKGGDGVNVEQYANIPQSLGGKGNGNGGNGNKNATNGGAASGYIFNDSSLGLAGGGGGGGGGNASTTDWTYVKNSGAGGAPNGGHGAGGDNTTTTDPRFAQNGTPYGGGGGGGLESDVEGVMGKYGNGAQGVAYLRFHFDAA